MLASAAARPVQYAAVRPAYLCIAGVRRDCSHMTLTGRVLGCRVSVERALLRGRRFAVPEVTPVAGHGAEGDRRGTSAWTIRMLSGSSVRIPVPEARGAGGSPPAPWC